MEKITDFLKELKERLSNPLIASFILSWLSVNWRITFAIFFYNRNDYSPIGISGFIRHLKNNPEINSNWKLLWLPLIFAIVYTIAFPLIRTLIYALNTAVNTFWSNWHKKISKESKIPIKKFLSLRDDYLERTQKLDDILTDESKIIENNRKLVAENQDIYQKAINLENELVERRQEITKQQMQIIDLQNAIDKQKETWSSTIKSLDHQKFDLENRLNKRINGLKSEIELANSASNPKIIQGKWEILITDEIAASIIEFVVNPNNQVTIKRHGRTYTYELIHYFRDYRSNELKLLLLPSPSQHPFKNMEYYDLSITAIESRNDGDKIITMQGTMNGNTIVKFQRK